MTEFAKFVFVGTEGTEFAKLVFVGMQTSIVAALPSPVYIHTYIYFLLFYGGGESILVSVQRWFASRVIPICHQYLTPYSCPLRGEAHTRAQCANVLSTSRRRKVQKNGALNDPHVRFLPLFRPLVSSGIGWGAT